MRSIAAADPVTCVAPSEPRHWYSPPRRRTIASPLRLTADVVNSDASGSPGVRSRCRSVVMRPTVDPGGPNSCSTRATPNTLVGATRVAPIDEPALNVRARFLRR